VKKRLEQENFGGKEEIDESSPPGVLRPHLGDREDKAECENSPAAEAVAETEAESKVSSVGD